MKLLAVGAVGAVALCVLSQTGCGTGVAHWGTGPDDAFAMVQADSECDLDRGTTDLASPCFVSRRQWGSEGRKLEREPHQ